MGQEGKGGRRESGMGPFDARERLRPWSSARAALGRDTFALASQKAGVV
jgi:hypothetical protein